MTPNYLIDRSGSVTHLQLRGIRTLHSVDLLDVVQSESGYAFGANPGWDRPTPRLISCRHSSTPLPAEMGRTVPSAPPVATSPLFGFAVGSTRVSLTRLRGLRWPVVQANNSQRGGQGLRESASWLHWPASWVRMQAKNTRCRIPCPQQSYRPGCTLFPGARSIRRNHWASSVRWPRSSPDRASLAAASFSCRMMRPDTRSVGVGHCERERYMQMRCVAVGVVIISAAPLAALQDCAKSAAEPGWERWVRAMTGATPRCRAAISAAARGVMRMLNAVCAACGACATASMPSISAATRLRR